jgi:hypothetical protein
MARETLVSGFAQTAGNVVRTANPTAMAAPAPLTTEQMKARERWQARWALPILMAALAPLFLTSPKTR